MFPSRSIVIIISELEAARSRGDRSAERYEKKNPIQKLVSWMRKTRGEIEYLLSVLMRELLATQFVSKTNLDQRQNVHKNNPQSGLNNVFSRQNFENPSLRIKT